MNSIDVLPNWSALTTTQRLLILRQEKVRRVSTRRFDLFYPETGPLRRSLYQKHLEFFRVGRTYRERCFMAANRVGKTEGAGGYEMTCHLTGRYPHWWEGRRFSGPVRCWAAGKTNETTRDVPQLTLLGPVVYEGDRKTVAGTGLIRGEFLDPPFWKQGVSNLVDTIKVRHAAGGRSLLGFKR